MFMNSFVKVLLCSLTTWLLLCNIYGSDLLSNNESSPKIKEHRAETRLVSRILSSEIDHTRVGLDNDDFSTATSGSECKTLRNLFENTMTTLPRDLAYIFNMSDIAQLITGVVRSDGSLIPGSIMNIRDLSSFSRTSKGNYIAASPVVRAIYRWHRPFYNSFKNILKSDSHDIFYFYLGSKHLVDSFRKKSSNVLLRKESSFLKLLEFNINLSREELVDEIPAYYLRALAKSAISKTHICLKIALLLHQLGQTDEASRILVSIIEDTTLFIDHRFDAAWLLNKIGKRDEVIRIFMLLASDATANFDHRLRAIAALSDLDKKDEAIRNLRSIVEDANIDINHRLKAAEKLNF
jgi:tetratricopeptide (TPR) repeat protein